LPTRKTWREFAKFVRHPSVKLNALKLASRTVSNLGECTFECINNQECYSVNFGRDSPHGKHPCELLEEDKFRRPSDLVDSGGFDHYYIRHTSMIPIKYSLLDSSSLIQVCIQIYIVALQNATKDDLQRLYRMSSSVTCINCNRTVKKVESRPIVDVKDKIIGRACQACRNATIRLRCSALKCTNTPKYAREILESQFEKEVQISQHKPDKTPELMSKAKKLKGYLLLEFQANLKTHSECATHCASLWLSDDPPCGNISQHQETCQSCLEIFHLIREIKECSNYSNDPQIADEVAKIEENLNNYT
ncbi:hypothetical protein OS493_038751, partial [Desmophyllum pertusum]